MLEKIAVLRYGQGENMTSPENTPVVEQKPNDKEYNFRQLESKYERMLAQERAAREEAERMAREALMHKQAPQEEEEDNEPYVDHKKLQKKLNNFEKNLEQKFERKVEEKALSLIETRQREEWLENNPDFFDTLQHADKFATTHPHLAKTILRMPEGFERQKLVYQNIKALGINKPEVKQPSIQEVVDSKKKGPYYQPSNIGTAPYAGAGDFSPQGQKAAHAKMQQLKNNLRLG